MKETKIKVFATPAKLDEIHSALKGYWENDIWNITDPFFDEFRPEKWYVTTKTLDLSQLKTGIKEEIKYFYVYRISNKIMRLQTAINYRSILNHLTIFLNQFYPDITSIIDIAYEKFLMHWRSYLTNQGLTYCTNGRLANPYYISLVNQLYIFLQNFYDDREEFEKDIWDVRMIPGAKFTDNSSGYLISFLDIPLPFRQISKRYLKVRVGTVFYGQCRGDLLSLRLFFNFIHTINPKWQDLKLLTRKDMEEYLSWYRSYTAGYVASHLDYLISLRMFLAYIQRAGYPEAPDTPSAMLIFNEDMPRLPNKTENDIKYIPEGVLQQLDDNLEYLTPPEYITEVVLLRASGWRVSDILNLRYDKCLERTAQGWWLCGDIPKTNVLNHRVPINDEVAIVVQAAIDEVKEKSTSDNNPRKLLFVRFDGTRKGRPPLGSQIRKALNRLAKAYNIVDDQGQLFYFKNHSFRHTKGVELINNGMSLVHVQKWMAHVSPEMTLRYAKILDTTMRKSWEEATRNGLFRIDPSGKAIKIDPSDIENEDLIEWEYIRSNLDAVRMPLGYCMKPNKVECKHQLNPCLTCRNLCTTPDFIPQYEIELMEVKVIIERGRSQGRTIWVEKNEALLDRYEAILAVLKEGRTHHLAGKKGREYVGEERAHAGNS
jgi:integrase